MPQLIDLVSKVTINSKPTQDAGKSMYQILRNMPREELTIQNKLRTTLHTNKIGINAYERESNGEFAGWRNELNRAPKTDCFTLSPINKVKEVDESESLRELERELRHREWLKGVDERIRKMNYNDYKA